MSPEVVVLTRSQVILLMEGLNSENHCTKRMRSSQTAVLFEKLEYLRIKITASNL